MLGALGLGLCGVHINSSINKVNMQQNTLLYEKYLYYIYSKSFELMDPRNDNCPQISLAHSSWNALTLNLVGDLKPLHP